MTYLFFDHASTTQCWAPAAELVRRFSCEDFGNPSSSHAYGQQAARAIREARAFFAQTFKVEAPQVIFTGGGTEADNLAVYGVALDALARGVPRPRVLASSIEHPAVRKTALSLAGLGVDVQLIPVDRHGQIRQDELRRLLTPATILVSIQQVNNIMGATLPVEELARFCKDIVPGVIFHTDAVQSFGKIQTPTAPSAVDLLSISAHKIFGPKGIGALIVLNRQLLKSGLRPLIWGGEQEGGFRSGTQSAGLIAGFHAAAIQTLKEQEENLAKLRRLNTRFRELLAENGLLHPPGSAPGKLHWNSPEGASPQIANFSFPGYPSGLLARMLEERGCLVATGSACSSGKAEPDAVLTAMGLAPELCTSAIRVSFSPSHEEADVRRLVDAIDDSIRAVDQLLG